MPVKDNNKLNKITTVKITKHTKERIEKLRSYKRETYDELLSKLLEILSICRITPERARLMLISLDQKHQKVEPDYKKKEIRPNISSSHNQFILSRPSQSQFNQQSRNMQFRPKNNISHQQLKRSRIK